MPTRRRRRRSGHKNREDGGRNKGELWVFRGVAAVVVSGDQVERPRTLALLALAMTRQLISKQGSWTTPVLGRLPRREGAGGWARRTVANLDTVSEI